MGFFSDIADEVRRNDRLNRPAMEQTVPAPSPFPAPIRAVSEPAQAPAEAAPAPEPASEEKPDPAPAVDLTDRAADDAERRRAHEAAEAKRKAEFDKKQAEKTAKRQAALDRIKSMNDAELLAAAAGRVAADTERLTRRNMKEAVAGHIQAKCRENAAFAMLVMDPDKSMINCFQYINRKAQEYAEQEMKDQGLQRTGVYGLDIPDGLCCKWAEDYFNDPDAPEDHGTDERFVPKPYTPAAAKKPQGKTTKKSQKKKPVAEKPAKAPGPVMEQISLM